MTKRTFKITVKSPYGSQPIEQFRHFVSKISDEAQERWGIEIDIREQADAQVDQDTEFE